MKFQWLFIRNKFLVTYLNIANCQHFIQIFTAILSILITSILECIGVNRLFILALQAWRPQGSQRLKYINRAAKQLPFKI